MASSRGGSSGEEDGSTPLFFLLAILGCIVLPWSLTALWGFLFPGSKNVDKLYPTVTEDGSRVRQCQTQAMNSKREAHIASLTSRKALYTRGFVFRTIILLLLWCWLTYIVVQLRSVMSTSSLYADFDPYRLLELGRSASKADVKKAWRRLSLKYHPDKNKETGAVEKFILMKKAYDSLTDPIASKNYAMYGNPDGPTRVELGMAIPTISKDQQGIVLVLFLLVFVLGVPIFLLCCMMGGADAEKCPNGVLKDTMEAVLKSVSASTDVKAAEALLLSSAESLGCVPLEAEKEELKALAGELKVKAPKGLDQASKAHVLFAVHCKRLHGQLSDSLRQDLDSILPKWRLISLAIAEVAMRQGFPIAVEGALELHRSLVQALEPGASGGNAELLQVPHLDVERIKQLRKGPHKALDISSFAELSTEERKKSLEAVGLSTQELLDAEEFAKAVPRLSIVESTVFVEGEDNVCKDDIATLRVKLSRKNLAKGEAAGAVHAPFFASVAVPEAWWLSFTISAARGAKTRFVRVTNTAQEVDAVLRFSVPSVGKNRCKFSLFCETYVGLAIEQQITFEAKLADNPGNGGADPDDDVSD
mmetsp:Transcript_39055/g.125564  ORF Transcript_39055/g.125564 Transcript_39055/m.125564 type:complete len:590 (-) Transcript_39055:157-1926(-)